MEKGETRMIYGNPIKKEYPIGKAKLIKRVTDLNVSLVEQWRIEYLSEPGKEYIALIKKEN
jgi:hypothetical protein